MLSIIRPTSFATIGPDETTWIGPEKATRSGSFLILPHQGDAKYAKLFLENVGLLL